MKLLKNHAEFTESNAMWWLQRIIAILVIGISLWYHGYYYNHIHQKEASGKVDLAVFYTAGSAITQQADLKPIELYTQSKIRPAIEVIRKQDGGSHYLYLPQAALLFAPATILPFKTFASVWAMLDILLVIISVYAVVYWLIGDKHIFRWRWTIMVALVTLAKTTESLTSTGQINGAILALLVLTFIGIQQHKTITSGISLGIATTLKVFPVIWFPYFALKKQWRLCIAGIVTGMLLWVASMPFFGVHGLSYFVKEKLPIVASGEITGVYKSSSIYGSLRQASRNDVLPHGGMSKEKLISVVGTINTILTLAIFAVVSWLIFKKRNEHDSITYLLDYGLMMCFVLLSAKIVHQQYHLWIVPILLYLWHFPFQKRFIWLHGIALVTFLLTQFGKVLPIPGIDLWILKPQTIGIIVVFVTIITLRTDRFKKFYAKN